MQKKTVFHLAKVRWKTVLLLRAILIRNVYVPISSIYSSMEDVYYHLCICEVEGSYTEEKHHYVEELFENPPQDKLENWDFYQLGYEKLIERMNHVSGLKNGVIFYERGYEQLTGQNRKMELFHAMLCMFLVIILITPIWSIDHTTGMERLIDTTCNGKKVERVKRWSALAIGAVVYLATYIPWNYNVLHAYGADYLGVSANNLQHLALLPDGITIFGFMVGIHIFRLIVLCAVIFGIRFISRKNRSYLQALMVSTITFLVPLFIAWILEV